VLLDKSREGYLTATHVAEVFQVSAEAVRGWAETGKLAGFKTPGGHWRFRRVDVEAFLPNEEPAA
jgi:excisionase family DNA binding protein